MVAKSSHGIVSLLSCLPEDGFEKQEDGSYIIKHPYKSFKFHDLSTALEAIEFVVQHENYVRRQISDQIVYKAD